MRDGKHGVGVWISVMGEIYDVSSGWQHYGACREGRRLGRHPSSCCDLDVLWPRTGSRTLAGLFESNLRAPAPRQRRRCGQPSFLARLSMQARPAPTAA